MQKYLWLPAVKPKISILCLSVHCSQVWRRQESSQEVSFEAHRSFYHLRFTSPGDQVYHSLPNATIEISFPNPRSWSVLGIPISSSLFSYRYWETLMSRMAPLMTSFYVCLLLCSFAVPTYSELGHVTWGSQWDLRKLDNNRDLQKTCLPPSLTSASDVNKPGLPPGGWQIIQSRAELSEVRAS